MGGACKRRQFGFDCIIELQKVHSNYDTVKWKDTYLRNWLNSTFINTAFSADEQSFIQETEISPGVTDKVFILSNNEIEEYMGGDWDLMRPTASQRVLDRSTPNSPFFNIELERSAWWTRSSVGISSYCYVSTDGEIYRGAQLAQNQYIGIRPAMWIETD